MYKIKVNIKGCESFYSLYNFIKSHKIKLVLFAETHGYLDEIPIQKKIIQIIRPDFFIYEMLEEEKILNETDFKRFLDKPNTEDFSVISTYGELKPTLKLARKFNLPIIGCDIKDMFFKDKDFLNKKISIEEEDKITKKRELRQSKVINQYTSKGLVFASIGAYHLRKDSITISNLKEKRFIIVMPLFNGKENFRIIPKNVKLSKVSYIINENYTI